jgi:hypothetical protein
MTKAQIERHQDNIETLLAISIDPTDGNNVKGKLSSLGEHLNIASQCILNAKRAYLQTYGEWLRRHTEKIDAMKPSVAKHFIETACIDEQLLLVRCEQNYKDIGKCSDGLITILSYLKAEMSL